MCMSIRLVLIIPITVRVRLLVDSLGSAPSHAVKTMTELLK